MKKTIQLIMSKSLLLILMITIFYSCQDDDDLRNENFQSFEIKIDGEELPNTNVTAKISSTKEDDYERRTLEISFTSGKNLLKIEITNYSWQNLPTSGILTKTYYTGDNDSKECLYEDGKIYCEMSKVYFFKPNNILYITPLYSHRENNIQIISNDTKNRLLSGLFDVITKDLDDNELRITGNFKDLRY